MRLLKPTDSSVGSGAAPYARPACIAECPSSKIATRRLNTRSFTDFWQGAGVDREKLSQALPQLPDTADEILAVAQKLGVPAGDIALGRDATETAVKTAPLSDYRIVILQRMDLSLAISRELPSPRLHSQSQNRRPRSTMDCSPQAKSLS